MDKFEDFIRTLPLNELDAKVLFVGTMIIFRIFSTIKKGGGERIRINTRWQSLQKIQE